MSTIAVVAGVGTAIKVGKKAVNGYKAANRAGRRNIAKKELEREKDIDKNGCIGCVGKCIKSRCPVYRTNGLSRNPVRPHTDQ